MARVLPGVHPLARSPIANAAVLIAAGTLGVALLILIVVTRIPEMAGIRDLRVARSGWGFPGFGHAAKAQERIHVGSLQDLRNTVFFDPATGESIVWYAINAQGETELFQGGGLHPQTGEALKPVTPNVVQLLERRLKVLQQERVAQEERRTATARADAEIERVRKRLISQATGPANGAEERARRTAPERPSPAPRLGGDRDESRVEPEADRDRAIKYDELVSAARMLIDAGRWDEARSKAQRALHVDPRRMAARSLWAEAQTKIDARDTPATTITPSGRTRH
jgi:hypothetical protein